MKVCQAIHNPTNHHHPNPHHKPNRQMMVKRQHLKLGEIPHLEVGVDGDEGEREETDYYLGLERKKDELERGMEEEEEGIK